MSKCSNVQCRGIFGKFLYTANKNERGEVGNKWDTPLTKPYSSFSFLLLGIYSNHHRKNLYLFFQEIFLILLILSDQLNQNCYDFMDFKFFRSLIFYIEVYFIDEIFLLF